MKILNALILAASVVCLGTGAANAGKLTSCEFNGKPLHGKVQIVNSFPDFKVEVVNSFPDLDVQVVKSFPDSFRKWQIVNSFPDFKVQIVNSFGDFKIRYVNSFPGLK